MKEMNVDSTYDEGILNEGIEYNVATNNGKEFDRAIFTGYKMQNGKKMMCFKTQKSNSLIINPSYLSSIMEQNIDEFNSVTYQQAEDAWDQRIGERKDG